MILLMFACGDPPETPPPPPVEPEPTVSTLLGDASGVDFAGNWTSPNCGGRAYARNIRFEEDHTYAAIDLVSPCAPGAQCVWSGMVGYAGTWNNTDDKKLKLLEMGAMVGPGSPHPHEFVADFKGNLIESSCVYTKGLTIPPGYTEQQVTPRVPTVGTVPPPAPAPGEPTPDATTPPSPPTQPQ